MAFKTALTPLPDKEATRTTVFLAEVTEDLRVERDAVASYLNQDLSNEQGLSTTIQKLVDEGRLGIKTKGGIFDYDDEKIAQLRAQRFGGLVKVRKALSD